jgi:spectinomycin phosphotransferase
MLEKPDIQDERIVEDIAVYCEQLFLTDEGGEDREQSLRYLQSNFSPGGTIEVAYKSDKALLLGCYLRS